MATKNGISWGTGLKYVNKLMMCVNVYMYSQLSNCQDRVTRLIENYRKHSVIMLSWKNCWSATAFSSKLNMFCHNLIDYTVLYVSNTTFHIDNNTAYNTCNKCLLDRKTCIAFYNNSTHIMQISNTSISTKSCNDWSLSMSFFKICFGLIFNACIGKFS